MRCPRTIIFRTFALSEYMAIVMNLMFACGINSCIKGSLFYRNLSIMKQPFLELRMRVAINHPPYAVSSLMYRKM